MLPRIYAPPVNRISAIMFSWLFAGSWSKQPFAASTRSTHTFHSSLYTSIFKFQKIITSGMLIRIYTNIFFLLCDWIPASMPEWRIFAAGWNILLIRTVNAPVADEPSLVIKLDDRILHVSIKTEHAEEQTDKKTDNIVIVSVLRVNLAGH